MEMYRLIGRLPVSCTMEEYVRWRQREKKAGLDSMRVAETIFVEGFSVSTVFLGLDHKHFGDEPLLFETMVFGEISDTYQNRCTTWDQAEKMHDEAVKMVQAQIARGIASVAGALGISGPDAAP